MFDPLATYTLTWKPDKSRLKRPIYQSLAELLEEDIARGILMPGTKLPAQRELAYFLGINFTTVTRTYKMCELKGLVYAVTGSGTFVASRATVASTISIQYEQGNMIDLGFMASFESTNEMIVDVIKKISNKRHVSSLLDYHHQTGMPHQKAAAVNWLSTVGVKAQPDNIMIVPGAQSGLNLCLLALFEHGSRIAVDNYTFANFIELAKLYHVHLVPIQNDEDGMIPQELERQARIMPIDGVYLIPSCANPTTIMMSEKRKGELAEVIVRNNMILIEDDIFASYIEGDFQSMQSIIPEQTVYVGGISKSLAAGLRIAYIVSGEKYRERLEHTLLNALVKTSSLDAEVATELIQSGMALKVLEAKKHLLRVRTDIFMEVFPEYQSTDNQMKFFKWLPIKSQKSGVEIEEELKKLGVIVYHSDRFLCGKRQGENHLRIALSTEDSDEVFRKGLLQVREYLDNMS